MRKLATHLALAAALLGAACGTETKIPLQPGLESFQVEILEISPTFPPLRTGDSPETALPIPTDKVLYKVRVTALASRGAWSSADDTAPRVFTEFNRPVSFRVTPGRLAFVRTLDGKERPDQMLPTTAGVAEGWVAVERVFGAVHLWAEDAPPAPVYQLPASEEGEAGADAGVSDAGVPPVLEKDPSRTFASGISRTIFYRQPTILDVQRVPNGPSGRPDNRLSPFMGNFLTVEAPYPTGDMIVTAITSEGFFLTDRIIDDAPRSTEGGGTLGSNGHIFVYNFSFPDGLQVGSRVNSITGTVQEFSGSTQLVFPSWVAVEADPKPQDLPKPLIFDFSDPTPERPSNGFRMCGIDTKRPAEFPSMVTLCGYSNTNVEMESQESGLVKLVDVIPSNYFQDCDANGNSNIPPFRWWTTDGVPGWFCDDNGADTEDCRCNADCISSEGMFTGKVCTEENTWREFGQWLVLLEENYRARLNVHTRDALPELDPREFKKAEYAQCRLDITGILRQVQAARPRWMVIARDENDVCGRPHGGSCPPKLPICKD